MLPSPQPFKASRQIVAHLIDPETHHIISELNKALAADLVTSAEFSGPVPVVALAIDFDRKGSVAGAQQEIDYQLR